MTSLLHSCHWLHDLEMARESTDTSSLNAWCWQDSRSYINKRGGKEVNSSSNNNRTRVVILLRTR